MGSVVNGLELDGRVLDAEVGVDARLDLVEEFAEVRRALRPGAPFIVSVRVPWLNRPPPNPRANRFR